MLSHYRRWAFAFVSSRGPTRAAFSSTTSSSGSSSSIKELYIKDSAGLHTVLASMRNSDRIGLDTEFLNFPFYRPKLELMQIQTNDMLVAVDVPALEDKAGPIVEQLMNSHIAIHGMQMDMIVLHDLAEKYQLSRTTPKSVFDTQVACSILGIGGLSQIGYGRMLHEVLGLEIEKKEQLSDWSKRPLTPQQIEYALNDVRHLPTLVSMLTKRLQEAQRYEWFVEEMTSLQSGPFGKKPPVDAWTGVRRFRSLNPQALATMQDLAMWREEEAMRIDRIPHLFLRDDLLIAIAAIQPTEKGQIAALQGMKPHLLTAIVKDVLSLVKKSQGKIPLSIPASQDILGASKLGVARMMEAVVITEAEAYGLHNETLASVNDIKEFIVAANEEEEHATKVMKGFRKHIIGEKLQRVKHGHGVNFSWDNANSRLSVAM